MSKWFVARTAGKIVWAGQYQQPGYADEQLDDASNVEIKAFLNPPPDPSANLAAWTKFQSANLAQQGDVVGAIKLKFFS